MTEQQCKELTEKINKYSEIKSDIYRMERRREEIESGIEYIKVSADVFEPCLSFDGMGDEFKEQLKETILKFIDDKIEKMKKQMEEI